MTQDDATTFTGLSARHNPGAHYDYLRCQLGETESVKVQTSAFRTITVPVFRLIAFGTNWENAVTMWEKIQQAKTMQVANQ